MNTPRDLRAEGWEVELIRPPKTYKVIRFYQDWDRDNVTILRGLTLDQAQAHCQREDTHGDGWFDGYEEESLILETCLHCGKVLHREIHDGHTFLIDDETGGDVCGSWGTYGNEPHEVAP